MKIGIVSFQVGRETIKFKNPLMLESENVDGGVCLTHKELTLSACWESFLECENIIREELAMVWEDYAMAPNDVLTADAIIRKNQLLAMAGLRRTERL